jgi:hypothetical protein
MRHASDEATTFGSLETLKQRMPRPLDSLSELGLTRLNRINLTPLVAVFDEVAHVSGVAVWMLPPFSGSMM